MSKIWGSTRNTLLTIAVCGAFAALAAGCSDDGGGGCPSGQTDCNGKCIDLASDEGNCGECGKACGEGFLCSNKTCACPGSATECDGTCTNTANDVANCGECGKACPDGQICNGGNCGLIGDCKEPKKVCGEFCADITSDNMNCGDCGTKCDETKGYTCVASACVCAKDLIECNGTCVDPNTSVTNCGTCGTACADGEVCQAGACKGGGCSEPLTDCSGSCVNTSSDPANCGACGTACETANGFVCTSGACACVGGLTDCSGKCVDTLTNGNNCGTCGTVCSGGAACNNGACVKDCAPLTQCGTQCIDITADSNHCGDCTTVCAGGKICTASACTCPATAATDCSGTCANLQTDEKHCGVCGKACANGESCVAGVCIPEQMLTIVVTCPETTVPNGFRMKCQATGTLQSGQTVDLTADTNLSWSLDTPTGTPSGTDFGTAGCTLATATGVPAADSAYIINTAPDKGLFVATEAGCGVNLKATYSAGAQTLVSPAVAITIVARKLLSIAVSPDSPTVPYLGTTGFKINFKAMATFDSGQVEELPPAAGTFDWTSGNLLVVNPMTDAAVSPATLFPQSPLPTTSNLVSQITVKFTDVTDNKVYTSQTVLTVAPGNATALTIEPGTATIPLGPIDFSIVGTFNNSLEFDVTDLCNNAAGTGPNSDETKHYSNYCGLSVVEEAPGPGFFTLSSTSVVYPKGAAPYAPGKLRETAIKVTTTTPAKVTASFADVYPAVDPKASALITITGAALQKCGIYVPGTVGTGDANKLISASSVPANNKFPVGLTEYAPVVIGTYSDGNVKIITTDMTYESSTDTVATVSNASGAEGEIDMLAVGTTTITATEPTSGVNCAATLAVVNNAFCALKLTPVYKGDPGRRAYRAAAGPLVTDALTNGTNYMQAGAAGEAALKSILLPNEAGWGQQLQAVGWYSMTTACPADCLITWDGEDFNAAGGCFSADVTSQVTWKITPGVTNDPAVTNATNGLFNVAPTTTAANFARLDKVEATFSSKTDAVNFAVCGANVTNTQVMYDQLTDATSTTVEQFVSVGGKTQYDLGARFKGQGTAPVACAFTSPAWNSVHYTLEITEDITSWSQVDASKATASNTLGSRGEVTGVAAGQTTITGNYKGLGAALDINIADLAVVSCEVTVPMPDLFYGGTPAVGEAMMPTITAKLSDGSTRNISTGFVSNLEDSVGAGCPDPDGAGPKPKSCGITWGLTSGVYASVDSGIYGGGTVTAIGSQPTAQDETVTATCVNCGIENSLIKNIVCKTTNSKLKIKAATLAKYFIQTPDMPCFAPEPGALSMNRGTRIDFKGCALYNNGAYAEIDGSGETWDKSQAPALTLVGPTTGWIEVSATGTGGNLLSSTFGTLNDTQAITVNTDGFTAFEIRGINFGAAGCSAQSAPAQPTGGLKACEYVGTTQPYGLFGVRADASAQNLSLSPDHGNIGGPTWAAVWSTTGATGSTGTLGFASNFATMTGVGDAEVTVNMAAFPTVACNAGVCAANPKAWVRIFAASPSATGTTLAAMGAASVTGGGMPIITRMMAPSNTSVPVTIDVTADAVFTPLTATQRGAFFLYGPTGLYRSTVLSMPVSVATTVDLEATFGGIAKKATLTVNP